MLPGDAASGADVAAEAKVNFTSAMLTKQASYLSPLTAAGSVMQQPQTGTLCPPECSVDEAGAPQSALVTCSVFNTHCIEKYIYNGVLLISRKEKMSLVKWMPSWCLWEWTRRLCTPNLQPYR